MIYSTPCNITNDTLDCFSALRHPTSATPCSTGNTALSPMATNIAALNGRQLDVLNRGSTDSATHTAASTEIMRL